MVNIPAGTDANSDSYTDADVVDCPGTCAHRSAALCDGGEAATDEDVNEQLWRDDCGGESVHAWMYGGERGHGSVRERIRERAETDHA